MVGDILLVCLLAPICLMLGCVLAMGLFVLLTGIISGEIWK